MITAPVADGGVLTPIVVQDPNILEGHLLTLSGSWASFFGIRDGVLAFAPGNNYTDDSSVVFGFTLTAADRDGSVSRVQTLIFNLSQGRR